MRVVWKSLTLAILGVFAVAVASAQPTKPSATVQPTPTTTEAGGEPTEDAPLDGIYEREVYKDKRILVYDHIREADVFYEKRIWRVIDTREKMNRPFVYPKEPLIQILMKYATSGEATVYSTLDDEFKQPMKKEDVSQIGVSTDTIMTYDPVTYEEKIKIVHDDLNFEDIKRYRIKEVWFFDEETSMLQVRILGISPLKEDRDDNGNLRFELPMFWCYYPKLRPLLARHEVFNPGNDGARMSWEDMFEMRFFSSYIIKQSNVEDIRIQDYKTGINVLFEAEKVKDNIFNFEQDLWEY
jgi:gliding motility associated protien GldN